MAAPCDDYYDDQLGQSHQIAKGIPPADVSATEPGG